MTNTRWIKWVLAASAVGCGAPDHADHESSEGTAGESLEPHANYYVGPRTEPEARGQVTILDEQGGLRDVEYEVRGGMAVAEGDIVLGAARDIESQDKAFQQVTGLWTKRKVPYTLGSTLTNTQKTRINDAIAIWNTALGVVFKPRVSESDYVEFANVAGVCDSPVGRAGGKQLIRLDPTGCSTAAIVHEMGHTLNLKHEHQRWDADDVIDVHEDRAITTMAKWLKPIAQSSDYKLFGASPDFNSIMMYDSYAFAAKDNDGVTPCFRGDAGCSPTLTKAGTENTWRAPTTLSATDIKAVRTLYNVFDNPTVKTSLALYTPIRWFSASQTNKNKFCEEYGYRTADASEATQTLPANTVVASYNTSTRTWEATRINLPVGSYTKITCKF